MKCLTESTPKKSTVAVDRAVILHERGFESPILLAINPKQFIGSYKITFKLRFILEP